MFKEYMVIVTMALLFTACSKSQVNMADSPLRAEVELFEGEFEEAKTEYLDLLAPTNFSKAEAAKQETKEMLRQGKDSAAITKELQKARAHLDRATEFSVKAEQALAPVLEAREKALNLGADRIDAEFQEADRQLKKLSESIEENNVDVAMRKRSEVIEDYNKLQMRAIKEYKPLQ